MFRGFQRLHLILFLGVVAAKASTSPWAQALPPELRGLYKEADVDPDGACLKGVVPTSPAEHADRRKCMLAEYLEQGGALANDAVHLRGYARQAEMAEQAATEAEQRFERLRPR